MNICRRKSCFMTWITCGVCFVLLYSGKDSGKPEWHWVKKWVDCPNWGQSMEMLSSSVSVSETGRYSIISHLNYSQKNIA